MRIQVTKKHIQTATKRNSHHCMIADAIADRVHGAKYILVDLQSIRWTNKKVERRYVYLTPPIAQDAIIKFDRGIKDIQPFIFTIENPRIKNTRRGKKSGNRKNHIRLAGETRRTSKVAYKDREYGVRKFKK